MPQFDLEEIFAARYACANGVISYSDRVRVGGAMTANIELKNAEGRLYSEGALSHYKRKVTGSSVSLGVDAIATAAKKLLYGAQDGTARAGVTGLRRGAKQQSSYVGVTLIAPDDDEDGSTKYTTMFVTKALFGEPSMSFKTAGDSIQFATPTTTGELLAGGDAGKTYFDDAQCDTLEEAQNWCAACLGAPYATPSATALSKAASADLTVAVSNGAAGTTATAVTDNGAALTVTTDYTYASGTLTVKTAHFASAALGEHIISVTLSTGETVSVNVTVTA